MVGEAVLCTNESNNSVRPPRRRDHTWMLLKSKRVGSCIHCPHLVLVHRPRGCEVHSGDVKQHGGANVPCCRVDCCQDTFRCLRMGGKVREVEKSWAQGSHMGNLGRCWPPSLLDSSGVARVKAARTHPGLKEMGIQEA